MRLLTLTTLYPNAVQIRNGIFVRERLHKLLGRYDLTATVIAPVPWFPFESARFGRFADFARVPKQESDGPVEVRHPRFVMVPRISESFMPLTYAHTVQRAVARSAIEFDVIDSHFAFPDGVAAALLARRFRRPSVVTVRGSDINIIAKERIAGRWIRWSLLEHDAVIAVSNALAERVREIVPEHPNVHVLANGVDAEVFAPSDQRAEVAREDEPLVLSVGNLIPLKGHHLVIEALSRLNGARLMIVGHGPMKNELVALAERLGVRERVEFVPEVQRAELVEMYRSAAVTVLASSNEGMPNVVLESLSCGTPVIATSVGGIPEVLKPPDGGVLLSERSSPAIARAVRDCLDSPRDAQRVRETVADRSWTATIDGLHALLERVYAEHRGTDGTPG